MAEKSKAEAGAAGGRDDEIRELVWILRRMMYVFISWAEDRYGWNRAQREDK